jgi:hypothetical protein
MSKTTLPPACMSLLVPAVLLASLGFPAATRAQEGGVTFWNRLEGGAGSVASEVGPGLYFYDPEVDGQTGANDVAGNPAFLAGRFGNAVTMGAGDYYSMARVHGLVLRTVSTVLRPERGTIAVWYRENQRPVAYQHNLYKLFDGGFGLDSPVHLYNNAQDPLGNLVLELIFGGESNAVNAKFAPPLGEWVQVAAVWDRAGIAGTAETARLYVDGVKVAAITTGTWGTAYQSNHADIGGGGDLMEGVFALDNLVLYDHAKTDFSDRFNESPLVAAPVFMIQTAAHLPGTLGANWRTDLELHNPGSVPASCTIALLEHDADNGSARTRNLAVDPGAAVRLTDVLAQELGFTGKAALRITATAGEVVLASRTYNRLGAGNPLGVPVGSTFGEYVPAQGDGEAIGGGEEGRLTLLAHTDPATKTGYRTNLGVVNAGADPVDVVADLYDAGGALLGSVRRSLPAFGYHQFDGVLGPWAAAPITDAYAVVHSPTQGGRFFAYAAVIDNRTGAPIFVPAVTRSRPTSAAAAH